jgi:hypothetical protein
MTMPVRPGRPCSICTSPSRKAIDKAILAGTPVAQIAHRFRGLSRDAVYRHGKRHIRPAQMRMAVERADLNEQEHNNSLALDARRLRGKAISLLLKAEQSGDLNTALRGIREAAGCLQLEARILGEIDNGPQVSVNVEQNEPGVVIILPSNGHEPPLAICTRSSGRVADAAGGGRR